MIIQNNHCERNITSLKIILHACNKKTIQAVILLQNKITYKKIVYLILVLIFYILIDMFTFNHCVQFHVKGGCIAVQCAVQCRACPFAASLAIAFPSLVPTRAPETAPQNAHLEASPTHPSNSDFYIPFHTCSPVTHFYKSNSQCLGVDFFACERSICPGSCDEGDLN